MRAFQTRLRARTFVSKVGAVCSRPMSAIAVEVDRVWPISRPGRRHIVNPATRLRRPRVFSARNLVCTVPKEGFAIGKVLPLSVLLEMSESACFIIETPDQS